MEKKMDAAHRTSPTALQKDTQTIETITCLFCFRIAMRGLACEGSCVYFTERYVPSKGQ